jgi:hypothetical protein
MKPIVVSLSLVMLMSTAAFAQKTGAGSAAKQQACRAEAHSMVRRSGGRSGGGNAEAMRAQWQGYYQICMAR